MDCTDDVYQHKDLLAFRDGSIYGRSVAAGYVSTTVLCPELIKQRLGFLEISGVKALGEPTVDWCKEVMGFLAFALLLPQASQAGRGAEFPRFGLLALGDADGVLKTGFGFGVIVRRLL